MKSPNGKRGGRRPGAGRPPKKGPLLDDGIRVTLTATDRAALDREAARSGSGPVEMARRLILDGLARLARAARRKPR